MMTPLQQALKRDLRDAVAAAGGGDRAAAFCRVGQQALSLHGNANRDDSFAPVDVVADLNAVTRGAPGHPFLVRTLAREAGYALVALPAVTPASLDPLDHLRRVHKEAADVVARLAEAAGGSIGAAQTRDLCRELDELIEVALAAKAAIAAADTG